MEIKTAIDQIGKATSISDLSSIMDRMESDSDKNLCEFNAQEWDVFANDLRKKANEIFEENRIKNG